MLYRKPLLAPYPPSTNSPSLDRDLGLQAHCTFSGVSRLTSENAAFPQG